MDGEIPRERDVLPESREPVEEELLRAAEMCRWAGLYLAEKAIRDMVDDAP